MENKELYRQKIEQKIKSIVVSNVVLFLLEDGTKITLTDHHDQDCCENVYADWETLKYYEKDIVGKTFKDMIIKGVEGMGFLICLYQDYEKGEKVFIPCYNEQNGYYSSDLDLIINGNTTIKISDLVEDHID